MKDSIMINNPKYVFRIFKKLMAQEIHPSSEKHIDELKKELTDAEMSGKLRIYRPEGVQHARNNLECICSSRNIGFSRIVHSSDVVVLGGYMSRTITIQCAGCTVEVTIWDQDTAFNCGIVQCPYCEDYFCEECSCKHMKEAV